MKTLVLQLLALLVFVAGMGVNCVHYCCDACRNTDFEMLLTSCSDVHETTYHQNCSDNCNHVNEEECHSHRLSMDMDDFSSKINLTKVSFKLPYLFASYNCFESIHIDTPDFGEPYLTTSTKYFTHREYLSKISVLII